MPPEVLGPLGLTAALLITVGVLWRDHLRADAEDRSQRDRAFLLVENTDAATDRIVAAYAALDARIARLENEFVNYRKAMAERKRRGDGG